MKSFIKQVLVIAMVGAWAANPAAAQLGKLKNMVKGGGSDEAEAAAVTAEEFWKVPTQTQDVLGTKFFSENKSLMMYKLDAKTAKEAVSSVFFKENSEKNVKNEQGVYTKMDVHHRSVYGGDSYPLADDQSAYAIINHPTASYLWGLTTGYNYGTFEDGTPKYQQIMMVLNHFAIYSNNFSRKGGNLVLNSAKIIVSKANFKAHFEGMDEKQRLEKLNAIAGSYYTNSQKNVANVAAAAEEERRKKYSIQGKDVKSIDVKFASSSKFLLGQSAIVDIIATLADGTTIDPNLAYDTDYEITVVGAHYDGKGRGILFRNDLEKMYPQDKVTVTVKSKFHPNVKPVTISQNMDYNEGYTFSFNAYNGNSVTNPKRPAGNVEVQVKGIKHAVTGEPLYEYRVFNNNKFEYAVRMTPNKTCYVNAKGYDGRKPGMGDQNGSSGGTITIIRDPSAADAKFVTNVSAGTPYAGGSRGSNGTVKELTQKVNW